MASAFSSEALYGPIGTGPAAIPSVAGPARSESTQVDPHDKADKGPSDWWEDPTLWLVLIAALGTGIIGFRFHWGPGASASGRVDVSDEAASMIGQAFVTMVAIVIFKIVASKIEIAGLQKFAAAI